MTAARNNRRRQNVSSPFEDPTETPQPRTATTRPDLPPKPLVSDSVPVRSGQQPAIEVAVEDFRDQAEDFPTLVEEAQVETVEWRPALREDSKLSPRTDRPSPAGQIYRDALDALSGEQGQPSSEASADPESAAEDFTANFETEPSAQLRSSRSAKEPVVPTPEAADAGDELEIKEAPESDVAEAQVEDEAADEVEHELTPVIAAAGDDVGQAVDPSDEQVVAELLDEDQEASPLPEKVAVVRDRRAYAEGEPYLPVCDPKAANMQTFIKHSLAGMAALLGQPGRKAMITYYCEPVKTSTFQNEARAWLAAHKAGGVTTDKKPKGPSLVGWKGKAFLLSLVGFAIAYLTHLANPVGLYALGAGLLLAVPMVFAVGYAMATGQRLGRGSKPAKAKASDDQPDDAHKETHKEVRALVNSKLAAEQFFNVTMDVTAFSLVDPEEVEEETQLLDEIVSSISGDIEATLEVSEHNYLTWESKDKSAGGIDVLQATTPDNDKPLVLSSHELPAMIKIPDESLRSVTGVKVGFSSLRPLHPQHQPHIAPDPLHPPKGLVAVGTLPTSSDGSAVAVENRSLDKHLIVVGRAGSGKSVTGTHIANGIAQDDYPMIVIDPHGELADDILASVLWLCPERIDDIVVVNIGDLDHPVALNPLAAESYAEVEWCVDNTLKMMENNLGFGVSTHPQARQIARLVLEGMATMNVRMAEVMAGDPSLKTCLLTPLHVNDFLLDPEFRQPIVEIMGDNSEQFNYFDTEEGTFTKSSAPEQLKMIMPMQRVFSALKNNKAFARALCLDNRLYVPHLIKKNKIVIFRLGGFEGSGDLGLVLAQMLFPAVLNTMGQWGRTKDPATGEYSGRGLRLLTDELPELAKGNEQLIGKVLAQARKYDFGLIGFAQFLRQLSPDLQEEFKANTSGKISFKLDPGNARVMSENISGEVAISDRDIVSLPRFAFYGTMVADEDAGLDTGVFAAQSLPPIPITKQPDLDPDLSSKRERVIEQSRQLVANDAEIADERLANLKGTAMVGMIEVLKAHNAEQNQAGYDQDFSDLLPDVEPGSGIDWKAIKNSRADNA